MAFAFCNLILTVDQYWALIRIFIATSLFIELQNQKTYHRFKSMKLAMLIFLIRYQYANDLLHTPLSCSAVVLVNVEAQNCQLLILILG